MKQLINELKQIEVQVEGKTYRIKKPVRFIIMSTLLVLSMSVVAGTWITFDNCTPHAHDIAVKKHH